MEEGTKASKGNGDAAARVAFDYIKNHHFRSIRADGAIGGITPNGNIHFALYSERLPLPKRLVHEVNEDGSLGPVMPNETVSRDAIVREMEVDVFLDISVARGLSEWLKEKLKDWDSRKTPTTKEELQ